MATPDMDVIKEIPGYKVILKAVLKSQIQQLVEQLASHTDEESVILTASVSDGTLSHLGSDSGKFFLDDHEDIKSQFLGFCLKRHHRKKQEKDREEAAMRNMQAGAYGIGPTSVVQRSPRMQSPRQQGVHPVSLTRASPGSGIRGSMRHEPYRVARPKRTSLTFDQQGSGNQTATVPSSTVGSSAVVKIEPADDNNTDLSNTTPSQNNLKTEFEQSNPSSDPQDVKFSDTQTASGLSLDSDLTNLISQETSQQLDGNEDNVIETNTATIKTEAISESDMELEITGVEPGRLESPQENWGANSTQTEYDQSGATGSSAEGQGYKTGVNRTTAYRRRLKVEDPEKYEMYLEQQRIKNRMRRRKIKEVLFRNGYL